MMDWWSVEIHQQSSSSNIGYIVYRTLPPLSVVCVHWTRRAIQVWADGELAFGFWFFVFRSTHIVLFLLHVSSQSVHLQIHPSPRGCTTWRQGHHVRGYDFGDRCAVSEQPHSILGWTALHCPICTCAGIRFDPYHFFCVVMVHLILHFPSFVMVHHACKKDLDRFCGRFTLNLRRLMKYAEIESVREWLPDRNDDADRTSKTKRQPFSIDGMA